MFLLPIYKQETEGGPMRLGYMKLNAAGLAKLQEIIACPQAFADPNQPRKPAKFTDQALQALNAAFQMNPRPSSESIQKLARETGLLEKQIRVWFQNRRARHTGEADTSCSTAEVSECADLAKLVAGLFV